MTALFAFAAMGAALAVVFGGLAFIADVLPEWRRRLRIQAAKRAARRQDVAEMAQHRARRRMVGGGL